MVKNKIASSLELLSISKTRVNIILKELINNLMALSSTDPPKELIKFKTLCVELKKMNIQDISSYITENIVDYSININNSYPVTANIDLFFQSGFVIDKLNIHSLNL